MQFLFPLLLCALLSAEVQDDTIRCKARQWAKEAPPRTENGNDDDSDEEDTPPKWYGKVSNYENVQPELDALPKNAR
jgi:hypothetical protein